MSNEKTIQLLQKSLLLDPSDWDTRLHIAELLTADGKTLEASNLLTEIDSLPNNEAAQLNYASVLHHSNTDKALAILNQIILGNKACALAYRIKADIYRSLSLIDEAKKQYNVAAVIDETLEDPEFEAWLQNPGENQNTPKEPQRMAQPVAAMPHSDNNTVNADIEPDVFIETDPELDSIIAAADRFLDFSNIGGMDQLKERIRMSIIHPFKNKELFKKYKKDPVVAYSFMALQAVARPSSPVPPRVSVEHISLTSPSMTSFPNGLAKPSSVCTHSLKKLDVSHLQ